MCFGMLKIVVIRVHDRTRNTLLLPLIKAHVASGTVIYSDTK